MLSKLGIEIRTEIAHCSQHQRKRDRHHPIIYISNAKDQMRYNIPFDLAL